MCQYNGSSYPEGTIHKFNLLPETSTMNNKYYVNFATQTGVRVFIVRM